MGLNNDRFRVCAARRNGDELEVRINGVLEGKVRMQAGIDLSFPGADVLVGGLACEALDGDVAEVVVIHEQTRPDELAAVERYLLEKYAL